jgi:hypothetical protein
MSDAKIREAVRKLAGTQLKDEVYYIPCVVNTVDLSTRTCDCTPIGGDSGTDIPGVLLMAEVEDGWLYQPTEGSTVIVSYSKRSAPYISLFSSIDNAFIVVAGVVQFDDGSYGGMTKTLELQLQLNKTNNLLNAILDILNGTPIPEPGNGDPSALQAALRAAISGQELGDYSQIENQKITHGI